MKRVPLCLPSIGDEEIRSVTEILKSGWLAHGPKNHEFEAAFAAYVGSKHAVSLNSCTSALYLALLAQDIRGEVILPSFTFVASVNSVLWAGATPVFADIERGTRNLDPRAIEKAITPRTEAIMVVHYAGLPCRMREIFAIAQKHKLKVIEDAAECIGGKYFGKVAGSESTGCFSFFPTKNITTGEGGMLTTDDDALAEKITALRGHGVHRGLTKTAQETKPWARVAAWPGFNFRICSILAAIGVEQMKKLDAFNRRRQAIAARYLEELRDCPFVELPVVPEGYEHVWQMFTVLVPRESRAAIVAFLAARGIEASVHFDPPAHVQPPYRGLKRGSELTVTDEVCERLVTLPIYPDMPLEDVRYVCESLKESFACVR